MKPVRCLRYGSTFAGVHILLHGTDRNRSSASAEGRNQESHHHLADHHLDPGIPASPADPYRPLDHHLGETPRYAAMHPHRLKIPVYH